MLRTILLSIILFGFSLTQVGPSLSLSSSRSIEAVASTTDFPDDRDQHESQAEELNTESDQLLGRSHALSLRPFEFVTFLGQWPGNRYALKFQIVVFDPERPPERFS